MQIILATPRGFCAGVERAIAIVEHALEKFGAPVYVRHEVVHNHFVCENLRQKDAIFIDELAEVPKDRPVIFSAHGVSVAVRKEGEERNLQVFDATCPLVTRVHRQVTKLCNDGFEIVMIGHKGHPEVEGTMGQCAGKMHLVEDENDVEKLETTSGKPLAYVTQTTLSVDEAKGTMNAIKARFPDVLEPQNDDICYATQNRQDAVRELAPQAQCLIVVGSRNSSNSNRLRELAERLGTPAYLVDEAEQLQESWFADVETVAVTAGASAPEVLVAQVVARIQALAGGEVIEHSGKEEEVIFEVPMELRLDA